MALSDTKLRAIRPTGKRREIADQNGLSIRVSQRGVMTWTATFRPSDVGEAPLNGAGRRRMALGEYPTIGLAEARQRALEIKRMVRAGIDPNPAAVSAPELTPAFTVSDLLDRYTEEHLTRNMRSGGNVRRLLLRHVIPVWGQREVGSIAPSDLIDLLEAVRKPAVAKISGRAGSFDGSRGGPGAAAEVRKWTRAMFQFAVERQYLAENTLAGVKNRDRQRPRSRVLTMDELGRVWRAAATLGYPWGCYFQLILLTGDRRGEWANAQSSWLSADGTRLEIPAVHYKTGKVQVVPLSAQALRIIAAMPKPEYGPYLLSSLGGAKPISGFSRAKERLDRLIANGGFIEPWVVHDLRRSMATHMERLGVAPHIIEVCLGHALKGISATYRRYTYLAEKAAALQLWANELTPEQRDADQPH